MVVSRGWPIGADGVERGVVGGIAVVPLRRRVFVQTAIEGDGQLAFGIVLAEEDLRDGCAAFLARIEGVQQGGNLVEPAARVHAAAAVEDHDGVRIGCGDLLNQCVLARGQREGPVVILALGGWVETNGDDDGVSLRDGLLFAGRIRHGGVIKDVHAGTEEVGDAGEDADRLECPNL